MNDQSIERWLDRLFKKDRRAVARIISLVEDGANRDFIISEIVKRNSRNYTIGFTGPPGSGKSSLIDALTALYRKQNETVGIVAVDPSSPYSGGAVLGDRLRMQSHSCDDGVFIRSMGTRGYLGGVARSTLDVLRILGIGGYNRLIVETVGVGQSETEIMHLVNTVMVVLNPGTGDSIQALKSGIMEIGDIFVINKSDIPGAESLKNDVEMMLHMRKDSPWSPPVVLTSVAEKKGLDILQREINNHQNFLISSGKIKKNEIEQLSYEVWLHFEKKAKQQFSDIWKQIISNSYQTDGISPAYLANLVWESLINKQFAKDLSIPNPITYEGSK